MVHDDAEAAAAQNLRGKCRQFMVRKHKYCTASIASAHGGDGAYCSIHRGDAARRVPCPLDPRHDVKEQDVARHMTICPSLKSSKPLWLRRGINDASTGAATDTAQPCTKLKHASREEGLALLSWLRVQHGHLQQQTWWRPRDLTAGASSGAVYQLQALEAYVRGGNVKHRQQQSTLCNLLLHDAARGDVALSNVVEVGAGKGGVACALKMAQPSLPIVLVERAVFRDHKERELNKLQRRALGPTNDAGGNHSLTHAPSEQGSSSTTASALVAAATDGSVQPEWTPIDRILLDARDFDAAAWWQHQQQQRGDSAAPLLCGVMGKHLCGACTDYTLRIAVTIGVDANGANVTGVNAKAGDVATRHAMHNLKRQREDPTTEEQHPAHSASCIVLATCCHHLCAFHSYVGRDAVFVVPGSDAEPVGAAAASPQTRLLFPDQRTFDLVRSICGWALIGPGQPQQEGDGDQNQPSSANVEAEGHHTHDEAEIADGFDAPWTSAIGHDEKLVLGRMAKTLIDAGRVWFLHHSNLFSEVAYTSYVRANISGEHYAIVASS